MFFGVVLTAGKVYSQVLENDLVLAQVALGGQSTKKGERSVLEVEVEGHKFVVATLRAGEVEQSQINLHFIAGTSIRLLNPTGSSDLHVLGNYIEEQDEDDFYDFDSEDEEGSEFDEFDEDSEDDEGLDDDDDDDDSSDEDVFARSASAKRGRELPQAESAKKQRTVSETFSKPSDNKTPSKSAADNKTPSKPAADNKTPSKSAASDNKTPSKPAADNKTPSKPAAVTPSKPSASSDNKTPSKSAADNKTPSKPAAVTPSKPSASSDNKTPNKTPSKASSSDAPEKVRLPSGLAFQVLKAAPSAAPVAKRGQRVVVSYKGTLQQGGKMFDSGDKFDFKLGAGEVIKGWDQGVEGMKVGEKRKLFVPAPLAYGKDGITERGKTVIPKNAALDFEVELLKIGR